MYRPVEVLPRERYQTWLAAPKRLTLAAAENGELLGFCAVQLRPFPDDSALQKRAVDYMEDLCVAQEHRRAGVGSGSLRRRRNCAGKGERNHWR